MTTMPSEPEHDAPMHRVVVGIDGSQASYRALEWAAAEAARTGAVLEAHASYGSDYLFISSEEVEAVMRKVLDQAANHVAAFAPGVSLKGFTHDELPAKILINASKGADLLVVGSRGHGGFSGLLLGSVSQQCALHAHCPVVIVRAPEAAGSDGQDGRSAQGQNMTPRTLSADRIVVGVDGSDSSLHALDWAARRAEMTGGSVEAVTAWEWPLSLGRGMPLSLGYDPATDASTILDQAIANVTRVHPDLVIHSKVVEGHLVPALLEASLGACMVVVGAGIHRTAAGQVCGPFISAHLARAHCPVVIVREDTHVSNSGPLVDPTASATLGRGSMV
jgi:nucleotide-binding universal stress UspA family protein